MKKTTKIQTLTLLALLAYVIYEFYFVRNWVASLPEGDPMIRVDLIPIYVTLIVLISVSIYQSLKSKRL